MPTAILGTIGGRVWVPVVFGVAQSFSPVQWLTLTGYGELDPGLDFNAVVAPTALKDATQTGDALSEAQLRDLFNRAVSWKSASALAGALAPTSPPTSAIPST